MKKSNCIDIIGISFIILLFIIIFTNYSYANIINDKEVIIGGELLEIDMKPSRLMVLCEDDSKSSLKNYDLVKSIEGKVIKKMFNKDTLTNVKRKDILTIILNMDKNETLKMNIVRNNKDKEITLKKDQINHSYFTEEINISGSLTYIDPYNKTFGCVGHDIDINRNKKILSPEGSIFLCNLKKLNKSNSEVVGNMYGEKASNIQGKIFKTDEFGARGIIVNKEIYKNAQIYKLGNKEDVKLGNAQLVIKEDKDTEKKFYDINISKIDKQNEPDICGFKFEIVDKDMLNNYGGIVQGMSGCPIIQNGKLIGALSHVITENPRCGMGVYINWMMED